MAQTYKFRYVNELVGTFVILVVILLLAGIFFAGRAQQWFEPVYKFNLTFPPEGSFGLKPGAEVVILGTLIGSLKRITVGEDGAMTGRIAIKGDFIRFVRSDSRAIVKKKYVVAGDSYIMITRGTGARLSEGATLKCVKDTEITEMIEEVVRQVKEATLPAIDQGRLALEEYTKLAADLRDPRGNLQQLVQRLKEIIEGLEKGDGMAGAVLKDPDLSRELREMVPEIHDSISRLRQIMDAAAAAVDKLPPLVETVSGELRDGSGMVLQTKQTLQETQNLIEGLQRHWLLRSSMKKRTESSRIPAAAVSGLGGEEP